MDKETIELVSKMVLEDSSPPIKQEKDPMGKPLEPDGEPLEPDGTPLERDREAGKGSQSNGRRAGKLL